MNKIKIVPALRERQILKSTNHDNTIDWMWRSNTGSMRKNNGARVISKRPSVEVT